MSYKKITVNIKRNALDVKKKWSVEDISCTGHEHLVASTGFISMINNHRKEIHVSMEPVICHVYYSFLIFFSLFLCTKSFELKTLQWVSFPLLVFYLGL